LTAERAGKYQAKRAERRKKRKGGEDNQTQKFKDKTTEIENRSQDNLAKSGSDKNCAGKPSGYIFTNVASDGSMSTTTCP